ncbi:PAS domain S-box protein [Sphingomonas sp. MMS24-JH45]
MCATAGRPMRRRTAPSTSACGLWRGGVLRHLLFPVPDDDGSVGGVLCIVSETTMRVRALGDIARESERLRESEARFRMLADSLPALVWLTDDKGEMRLANACSKSMLGFTPDQMVLAAGPSRCGPRTSPRPGSCPRPQRHPSAGGGEFRVVWPGGGALDPRRNPPPLRRGNFSGLCRLRHRRDRRASRRRAAGAARSPSAPPS